MRESIQGVKERFKNQKGFTLIELMAVLVILALILLIAVPAGGALIEKAKKSSDDSSIELIEKAGENAHIDKLPFDADAPEKDSYNVPTLIEKGYLKLKPDSKFTAPGEYVTKKNKGGEFVYKGKAGKGDAPGGETPGGETPGEDTAFTPLTCEAAEKDGYICINNADEFNDIRNKLDGKYILMENIDLSAYPDWTPIGNSTAGFKGVLHGNGKKIFNVISSVAYAGSAPYGVFGVVNHGEFKHLALDVAFTLPQADGELTSFDSAALIGKVDGTAAKNPQNLDFVLDDVHVTGVIKTSSYRITAGVVGSVAMTSGKVRVNNTSFNGEIDALASDGRVYGLMGHIRVERPQTSTETYATELTNNKTTLIGKGYEVSGAFGMINHLFGTNNVLIDGLAVDGQVNGSIVYGAADGLYSYWSNHNAVVRNVTVDGAFEASRSISGVFGGIYDDGNYNKPSDYAFKHELDNIQMNAALTSKSGGFDNTAGLLGSVRMAYGAGDLEIQNVDITGDLTGAAVSSLIGNYNSNSASSTTLNIHDITASGAVAASASYGGFVNYYNPMDIANHTVTISDAEMTSAVTGSQLSGFIHSWVPQSSKEAMTLTNVKVTGDYAAANAGGWINYTGTTPKAGEITYSGSTLNGTTVTN